CYVADEVRGLIALLDSNQIGPINIGNPTEFTMLELAEIVAELTGSTAGLAHEPLPSDDPKQRRPDITLATRHLDWAPTIALRAGLEKTIPYFADELKHQT
ncbi:MAG: SDR family NAD-dependent epimerase/dehydratase, partial [Ilumatobacter sp.]|nr:SDR family NAD-dependent epimerase/dehydratase [Ilumatobacter sp.]